MAFITADELATVVAAALHKDPGELETFWDVAIADANTSAYQEIVGKLLDRGYTIAQINAWDRGVEFAKAIGLYRALIFGVTADAYDDTWPEKLKAWIDQLDTVAIATSNVLVEPANAGAARVGYGTLSTANDIFSLDPDEPERDVPTVW